MRQLIIIPGIGDDHPVYHLASALFRVFGFRTHIHVFGWDRSDPGVYGERMRSLDAAVTALPGSVYILGVSAGGLVAISSLGNNPGKIAGVATLCSPLAKFSYAVNPLLSVAIEHVEAALANMDAATKRRILSIHGKRDKVVPLSLSQPNGVQTAAIPGFQHAISIFLGMTAFSYIIIRFFKQR